MCISVAGDIVAQQLSVTVVHPLTGRQLPVYVVTSRHYGEYQDVDLGTVSRCLLVVVSVADCMSLHYSSVDGTRLLVVVNDSRCPTGYSCV